MFRRGRVSRRKPMRRTTRRFGRSRRRIVKRKVFRNRKQGRFVGLNKQFRRRTGQTGNSKWYANGGRQIALKIQHFDGFDEEYVTAETVPTFAVFRLGGSASDPAAIGGQWGSLIQQRLGSFIQNFFPSGGTTEPYPDGTRPPCVALDWFTIRIRVQISEWQTIQPLTAAAITPAYIMYNQPNAIQAWWSDNFEVDYNTINNASTMSERDINDFTSWKPAKANSKGIYYYTIRWRNSARVGDRGIALSAILPTNNFAYNASAWRGRFAFAGIGTAIEPLRAMESQGFGANQILRVPALRVLCAACGPNDATRQQRVHCKMTATYNVNGKIRVIMPNDVL